MDKFGINYEGLKSILDARSTNYGNNAFADSGEVLNSIYAAINVAPPLFDANANVVGIYIRTLLALKAFRVYKAHPSRCTDSVEDFICYLILARDAGYSVSVDKGMFSNAGNISAFFENAISAAELTERIDSAFDAKKFLKGI